MIRKIFMSGTFRMSDVPVVIAIQIFRWYVDAEALGRQGEIIHGNIGINTHAHACLELQVVSIKT